MEQQLRQEKDKLLAEERQKERKLREELELELKQKDQLLQLLMEKHAQLEAQLRNVNTNEAETKQENAKLLKELNRLEVRLVDSERSMQEMQRQADTMRQHSLEEKRRRAKTAMKVTEGIAMERESLVKQLSLLRDVNKELTDQKDEINLLILRSSDVSVIRGNTTPSLVNPQIKMAMLFPKAPGRCDVCPHLLQQSGSGERLSDVLAAEQPSTAPREHADRRGSVLSNYIVEPRYTPTLVQKNNEKKNIARCSLLLTTCCLAFCSQQEHSPIKHPNSRHRWRCVWNVYITTILAVPSREKKNYTIFPRGTMGNVPKKKKLKNGLFCCYGQASVEQPRQPVAPERVFKVVIVGDSGVGKSCLLNRVCKNAFAPTFKSTIGVDFQVKSMTVDGRQVAMQLWDTAGQERQFMFRSITKQYYRRADGVILVYDVTSETSFKNIRGWMCNLQASEPSHLSLHCEWDVVLLLLGNKVDLTEVGEERQVSHLQGNKLAH
ncbi:unnamed protein product, partial [Ixodes pacificus]